MPEDTMYVTGLSGAEIITDLTNQIAAKLRNDCNLRETDNYTGGYSAEVKVKVNLYGLDAVETQVYVIAGKPKEELPSSVVDTEISIALEQDLEAVRERSTLVEPTLAAGEEPQVPRKRQYSKHLPTMTDGGATGEIFEQE